MSKLTRQERLSLGYQRKIRQAPGREERLDRALIDELLAQTHDPNPASRCAAVQSLCPCHVQANITPVWNRLLALAHDPDVRVRATILHTLCDGSPREREAEVVRALETMYQDPDPKLRRRVRQILAQYRRTGAVNIL
jgi:vesicle coat complex subunit